MNKKLLLIIALWLIGILPIYAQQSKTQNVKFLHSVYGDYLYFLFNKKKFDSIPDMDSLTNTKNIPGLGAVIALPEIVTSAQIEKYTDIYKIIDKYYQNDLINITGKTPKKLSYSFERPTADSITKLVKQGEPHFEKFKAYWQQYVEPAELKQINEWRLQLEKQHILQEFNQLTKLSLKSEKLEIAAMAYHLAGSANYSPAGVYTSLFKKPDLAWVIGHEGTHLLVSEAEGTSWHKHPKAELIKKLALKKGIELNEIEEDLCHFMQFKLSASCGLRNYDSPRYEKYEEGSRREMIKEFESRWNDYAKSNMNIIDLLMATAETVLNKMPDEVTTKN